MRVALEGKMEGARNFATWVIVAEVHAGRVDQWVALGRLAPKEEVFATVTEWPRFYKYLKNIV